MMSLNHGLPVKTDQIYYILFGSGFSFNTEQ